MLSVRSIASGVLAWIRSVTPLAWVSLLIRGLGIIRVMHPGRWATAKDQMRFVIGSSAGEPAIRKAARRYVNRMTWRGESRWHPELITHQRIMGLEHLRSLQEQGKGFILSFVHHGDWEGTFSSLARHGIRMHLIATSEMFSEKPEAWLRQQRDVIALLEGVTLVDVAVGSRGVRDLLARDCAVALALDPVGHTPVRFLGHDLLLSSGGTRIAMELDVPVVMMTSHPDERHSRACSWIKLSPPVFPHDFAGVDEFLEHLIRHQEEAILAWPEATDQPMRMLKRSLARNPTTFRRPD